MPTFHSHSTASGEWKSTCSVSIRAWSFEVDGGQHLADPVAYRRDRRKDQLLQEHGYLVLRYLAEDLAKELDSVLDGILRSLSSRRAAVVSTHTLNIARGSRL